MPPNEDMMGKSSKTKKQSDHKKISGSKETDSKVNQQADTAAKSAEAPGNRWTFLTNHAHVLILLHREPEIVLRQVAVQVGITERAVQRIIQDLEEEGFIHREKVGRQNRYEVLTDQPLRHSIEKHKKIGELLELVSE
ncbi:helix-turn-helix transcriptional regulator [Gimesia aquarii]|nr:winged helix-turn-helix transcriptional regulator [Gimesia aquarii]